jgi:hypothetical protein
VNTPVTQDLLVSNAISIADSAELLFMTVDATMTKEPELAGKTFIGGTVLCSFGIELLFKCIHSLLNADTKFPSGHDLEKLFSNIPDENIKNTLIHQYHSETGMKLEDFLLKHKRSFETWRYFSESTNSISFDSSDSRVLTKILKNKVMSLLADKRLKNNSQ